MPAFKVNGNSLLHHQHGKQDSPSDFILFLVSISVRAGLSKKRIPEILLRYRKCLYSLKYPRIFSSVLETNVKCFKMQDSFKYIIVASCLFQRSHHIDILLCLKYKGLKQISFLGIFDTVCSGNGY